MTLTKSDLQAIRGLLKENSAQIGDAMEQGFNHIDERIDDVEHTLDSLERRLNAVDDHFDRSGKTDEDHEKRIKKLEKVYSSV